jgi:predicted O-methyltransferase YrrM
VPATSGQERWTAVDRYLAERLLEHDGALAASACAGLPAHGVSPLQGRLLELLARIQGARRILELRHAGRLQHDLARAGAAGPGGWSRSGSMPATPRSPANLDRAGLADVVEVRVGRASDTLAALAAEGTDPSTSSSSTPTRVGNAEYLAAALELSRPGTLIVADNVIRGGSVLDGDDASAVGVRRFFDLIAAEPRLRATAIQTVGEKGYDGFALAVVL